MLLQNTNLEALFLKLEYVARTYPNIFISIAAIGIFLLLYLRYSDRNKSKLQKITTETKGSVISSRDIKEIAGDDVMTTQLDLARAYIEMNKKPLAKKILEHVLIHGNFLQKQEAQQLIDKLL